MRSLYQLICTAVLLLTLFTLTAAASSSNPAACNCPTAKSASSSKRVLILALDGTKGNVFWDAYSRGLTPSLASLSLPAHNNTRIAPCHHVGCHMCAYAHSGARYGSHYPSAELNTSNTDYIWVTSPGWASVFTGVDNAIHKVKDNSIASKQQFFKTRETHPTLLRLAKEALNLTTAASGAPDFLSAGQSFGILDFECTDVVTYDDNEPSCTLDYRAGQNEDDSLRDQKTTDFAIKHILGDDVWRNQPECVCESNGRADVVAAHFDLIDAAGHHCDFSINSCYLKAIQTADEHIGDILRAVRQSIKARGEEQWLVMVTSDHGGHTKQEAVEVGLTDAGHDRALRHDEMVPFIVSIQSSIDKPVTLSELKRPVRHFDVAPTVMAFLSDFDEDRYSWMDGQVQGIQKNGGEFNADLYAKA